MNTKYTKGSMKFICPYCNKEKPEDDNNCCGENHCTWVKVKSSLKELQKQLLDESTLTQKEILKVFEIEE